MKTCLICNTNDSKRWSGQLCNSCACKKYKDEHPNYDKNRYQKNIIINRERGRAKYHANRANAIAYSQNKRRENIDKYKEYDAKNKRKPKTRFRKSKAAAISRKLSWNLDYESYCNIIAMPCFYCNNLFGEPVQTGSGIDRIDNTIGYETNNVLSSCRQCNVLRNDILSSDETKAVVHFILQLRGIISSS